LYLANSFSLRVLLINTGKLVSEFVTQEKNRHCCLNISVREENTLEERRLVNIFSFRDRLIDDYSSYVQSFIQIRNPQIQAYVQEQLKQGVLWPNPLIQLSPLFATGASIDTLVAEGILHPECARIFRVGKTITGLQGHPLQLHKHQDEAIRVARSGASYVLTTGTGSGKSLAYMIPLVDAILRRGTGHGVQAIVVYPMNALANSQRQELEKFLSYGYANGQRPVTFERYTGQEKREERDRILSNPPDILLTNYVMLELILTRFIERSLLTSASLRFLVLDELHTYRGRQGADVALLVRRVRERLAMSNLQCVGTSATLASEGSYDEQHRIVAGMASQLFGTEVSPQHVIGETLVPSTLREGEDDVQDVQGAYSPAFRQALTERVNDTTRTPPLDYNAFLRDPLSVWLEDTFGITTREGRLVRTEPQSIEGLQHGEHNGAKGGAAHRLSALTGIPLERCIHVIQEGLLAGYICSPNPITGRPPFAFRLHQFISKGDTVYASLEANPHLTFQGQQFVPGIVRVSFSRLSSVVSVVRSTIQYDVLNGKRTSFRFRRCTSTAFSTYRMKSRDRRASSTTRRTIPGPQTKILLLSDSPKSGWRSFAAHSGYAVIGVKYCLRQCVYDQMA